ncbi:hypothetical protein TNCV_3245011 [Trichonephila clavipes]|nr:hypothetical protein TNCV_3245011 [Trichonephila clavipes]
MAKYLPTQVHCPVGLPPAHGCHYAFQKFPFFCATLEKKTRTKPQFYSKPVDKAAFSKKNELKHNKRPILFHLEKYPVQYAAE